MSKTIVITGATGFVGRKLCLELFLKGYQLKILCRSIESAKKIVPLPAEFILWNGYESLSPSVFEDTFGIIHLAGEPVAGGRWTKKRKQKILLSRTESTKCLTKALEGCVNPPQILVGASAIGFYGNAKDENLSEDSPVGRGFLAQVTEAWEKSYENFSGRLVMLRTGVVLGHGGALEKMLLPFRLGAGGRLSDGKQWMSWIHLDDLVKMYIYSLENENVRGPVNAVAPEPVRNNEFTKVLAKTLDVPAIIHIPKIGLKMIFGSMSSVLLDSQNVSAKKILGLGFLFNYLSLEEALNSILNPEGHKGCHSFSAYQWVEKDKDSVFSFFSKAENLEVITPPWLNFKIVKKSDAEVNEGTLIDYRLRIKGVPASWKTLISQWSPPHAFIDSQLKGPYTKWHHTHRFTSIQNGTLMTDEVIYKVPMGPIGHIVREIMIAKDVAMIFEYRNKIIKELF